jgi:hypothetical protein
MARRDAVVPTIYFALMVAGIEARRRSGSAHHALCVILWKEQRIHVSLRAGPFSQWTVTKLAFRFGRSIDGFATSAKARSYVIGRVLFFKAVRYVI